MANSKPFEMEPLASDAIDNHVRAPTKVVVDILQGKPAEIAHECLECGKVYKTPASLFQHWNLKHPTKICEVQCATCHKKYASELSLKQHIRYKHRYRHKCKICYRSFATIELLTEHGLCCSDKKQPCSSCSKVFSNEVALRNHVKYKHPKVKNNWCGICRREFTSKRGLVNHMASIHPPGTTCSLCDRDFNSVMALQSHTLYRHTEGGARCLDCRKVFATQHSLARHRSKVHNEKEPSDDFVCGICFASFDDADDIIGHVLDDHPSHEKIVINRGGSHLESEDSN